MQVVAIDPSAAFRKALRRWPPRAAVSVGAFHLVKLGNDMPTEVRQRLTKQVHGRRGRPVDPVWANRRLLLRAGDTLSDRARDRLSTVFATDDATGKLQAVWLVREQLRALLTIGFLAAALQVLVGRAAQPETNRLWRTLCRWWKEIEVLLVTGARTAKVEANNTAIKHIKRTGRGFTNARNCKTRILLRCAARTATKQFITAERSPRTEKSRVEASLKLGKGGLVPKATNLRAKYATSAELEVAYLALPTWRS